MSDKGGMFEFPPVSLANLRLACDAACHELGIDDMSALDIPKRERLVACIMRLARQGESDVNVLKRRALIYFQNTHPGPDEC